MQTPRSIAYRAFAATVVLLLVTGVAWGKGPAVNVQVLENTPQRILLQYDLVDLQAQTVLIAGQEYTQFVLEGESPLKTAGAPELPNVCRSIIIPDDSAMNVNVLETEYYDLEGVAAVPSKGVLLRTVDPASVPYTFGEVYEQDAFYPGELAGLRAPYILRDHRGAVVDVNLVQANPVAQTVRVYTKVVLEVVAVGPGQVNVLERTALDSRLSLSFHQIYKHHFINYGSSLAYAPLDETGDMLIICHDAWLPNIQPLVDHKSGIGITTTAVGVSTIGNNSTAIKNYIQSVYNAGNLAFVLLVGDADQVDTMYASGGSSDPSYALLAGSDSYPDIMIGRFSAESAGDVDTQVLRTIEYEQMPATQEDWFKRGMGVASNQGPGDDGEYDNEHIDNIRVDLLGYGYTLVDQIYDPYGTASQVTNGLNAGRGVINYCGHGSTTSWGSTGFSNTHVNALVNDNMLPFIVSVACVNGQFDGYTCFAEAWLRATHGSEPTGAIGMYASSINQSWDPPMCAQDETADLLVAEAYFSFGALCFGGSCQMMDEYGSAGVSMYNTWHVFGDPSVRVYGTAAPPTGLRVTPASGLDSSGPNGGPFTPDSVEYTLENMEDYPLDYSVTKGAAWLTVANGNGTLPAYGTAIVTVSINSVANTLGNGTYEDTVAFVNTTNHDGDADRLVTLEVGAPTLQYSWNMDTNPGWSTAGQWAWGHPTGGGGQYGDPDPTSGHTGSNVCGYNLSGDYAANIPEYNLTTTAIDCTDLTRVGLRFWRWLGVEQPAYDHAYIRVSNNGSNWTTIWQNTAEVADSSWQYQEFDISAVADDRATVYIRWTMGTSDGSWQYCGWNIDDVEIWAVTPSNPYPLGDLNCDMHIDGFDIEHFIQAIDDMDAYIADHDGDPYPPCDPYLADLNQDGEVNGFDIDPFVILLGG